MSIEGAARAIEGLAEIAGRYDGFIVDQWGVMHDGQSAYPGVIEALARLRAAGKALVSLSNSGRREADNRRALEAMGFDLSVFDGVVTSGEAGWRELAERDRSGADPRIAALGSAVLLVTRGEDPGPIEGLDLERVADVERADFLYFAGVDSPELGLEDYAPILERASARSLPMLCSNPDLEAPTPGGGSVMAPGAVAERYLEMGGSVIFVGKPHAPVYRVCFRHLRGIARERICAIGDSLQHDVRGANAAGIDSALVAGGVHPELVRDGRIDRGALERAIEAHAARPDWLLGRFTW